MDDFQQKQVYVPNILIEGKGHAGPGSHCKWIGNPEERSQELSRCGHKPSRNSLRR